MIEGLADFATAEFALQARQKDGHTLREHLISGWEQSGIEPPELAEAASIDPNAAHVWAYYAALHKRRQNYGWGHLPLTFLEIEAWQRLTRTRLDQWELDAILAIDDAYLATLAKQKPTSEGS